MSDDQSYPHTSAMGDPVVKTPAFDRVAKAGVLFRNGFCPAPQCAPARAALLTSRHIWQLEEAGTHASLFPGKFTAYTTLLERAGYHVGLTGKGAGPCNFKDGGWPHNPAGKSYDARKTKAPPGVNTNDYAANFADFLAARPKDSPFCFWFGSQEPHRTYAKGSGLASGKKLADVVVPSFLTDTEEVRSDLLDYFTEIEYFDRQLARHLEQIEKQGELDNTIVVVTGDNGMPFPHAKANMYDYGWHVPLAISWPARAKGGRVVDDLVGFLDFGPTYLEAAGIARPREMVGRSLLNILASTRQGTVDSTRDHILAGRERHSHARFDNLGYPSRAIRTRQHLYIRNFKPDRWPAGDPELFADIDDGPTKQFMMAHRDHPLYAAAFAKRPGEELFDIVRDPGCITNLAASKAHAKTLGQLRSRLESRLRDTGDPRMSGSEIFDSYPRYSAMRPELGGFSDRGSYNPKYK